MNDQNQFLGEFVKRASAAGLSNEQIKTFVLENFNNTPTAKTASDNLDEFYTNFFSQVGLEKNASSVAYLDEFVKHATDNGATVEQAIDLAKYALAQYAPKINKQAQEAMLQNPKVQAQLEGFFMSAKEAGLNDQEAYALTEKYAADPMGPMAGQAPAIPQPQAGKPNPEQMQQLMALIEMVQKDPQMLQQLLGGQQAEQDPFKTLGGQPAQV